VTEFERAIRAMSVSLGGVAPTSVATDAAAEHATASDVNIELATMKSSAD
jgi:hypothetical protein